MNPYDARNGGTKAMIRTIIVSRPNGSPYNVSKPIIKKISPKYKGSKEGI